MTRDEAMDQLLALDAQYEQITGHNAYLYVGESNGRRGFLFEGGEVMDSAASALVHMKSLVHELAIKLSESD